MKPMRVQLVWTNPRIDSLTAMIARDVTAALETFHAQVDALDLYRSGFDSVLHEADEPEWANPDKKYSDEVRYHASRTTAATAVVFVFPVWWYSLPALLKGYIDRVWNYGLLYGEGAAHNIAAVRWIGLAGHPREKFEKRGYDQMMAHHLNIGIADYCGIEDSQVHLLYNTLGEGRSDSSQLVEELRSSARTVAVNLMTRLGAERQFFSARR